MLTAVRDLQAIVHEGRRQGLRGVEVLQCDRSGLSLRLSGRGTPRRETTDEHRLIVRVWIDGGRRGEAVGAPDEALALLARATSAAALAPEDRWGGPVPRLQGPPRGLGIDDLRHDQLTDDDRLDVIVTHHKTATRGAVGGSGTFWYRECREIRRFANSHGVALEVPGTTYETGGELDVRHDGDPFTLREAFAGRAFASVACLPLGTRLAERASALCATPSTLAGAHRILLPPRATGKLIAWLADLLRDEQLAPGTTFVGVTDLEPAFHRRLHLVDDGGLAGGLRTRGFDDRGVTPIPLTLLREGYVAGRYLDPETARRLEARPTGHVTAGAPTPTNLQLNSGPRSISAWLGEQPAPVVEIDDLDDLRGIDRLTGDVDLRVNGVVWDRHERRGALRHARLRGNLRDALRQVVAVTSDTDRILHVDAPGLFLDGLRIAPR